MADTKISDLTAATSIAGTDLVPIVQSATTKKATWSLVFGTTSKVTGSNFTTTSTSLVDVTGLTFSASTSKLYEVDACLKVQSDNVSGLYVSVGYSAAGATGTFIAWGNASGTGAAIYAGALGGANNVHAAVANTDSTIAIRCMVTTGANAGNITIKVAKATSGTATVYIGSRMTVTELA